MHSREGPLEENGYQTSRSKSTHLYSCCQGRAQRFDNGPAMRPSKESGYSGHRENKVW